MLWPQIRVQSSRREQPGPVPGRRWSWRGDLSVKIQNKQEFNLANSLNRQNQFGHTMEAEGSLFCKAKLTQVISCCASENQKQSLVFLPRLK